MVGFQSLKSQWRVDASIAKVGAQFMQNPGFKSSSEYCRLSLKSDIFGQAKSAERLSQRGST